MSTYASLSHHLVPEIITYKHNDKLVYVQPARSYDLAVDIAKKEFEELADVPRESICFSVMSTLGKGERCPIRISESAWNGAVARLMRGEIINVYIRSSSSQGDLATRKSSASLNTAHEHQRAGSTSPPPQYLEVPKMSLSGGKGSSSSLSLRSSKSRPSSRNASPARKTENRRSWFGSIAR